MSQSDFYESDIQNYLNILEKMLEDPSLTQGERDIAADLQRRFEGCMRRRSMAGESWCYLFGQLMKLLERHHKYAYMWNGHAPTKRCSKS